MVLYKVYSSLVCGPYGGDFFIGAYNAEEAMEYIKQFKKDDPDNKYNSYALYDVVTEDDALENLFTSRKGIVRNTLWYRG